MPFKFHEPRRHRVPKGHRKVNREVTDFCDRGGMSKIARDPLYRRHRFPAEIIAHAVWQP